MITTLAGSNGYLLRQKLHELTSEFAAKYGDLAVQKIDAAETEYQAIMDAIQNLPFLAERQLIVLRGASQNQQLAEHIEQIISSIHETTDIIFYEHSTDKRTSFYKILKARTDFQEFNDLDASGLAQWLVQTAKKHDAKLSLADASFMVSRLGPNQQLLASELEKLAIHDLNITRQNIELLTEPTPQSRVFDLLEAAFSGQKARALAVYEEQRAQRVEPQEIIAMLAWQLNIFALCKLAAGRTPAQIAKQAGISEFPVIKASRVVNHMSLDKLKELVEQAADIDYKSKTQTYDLDEALKTYIATI